MRDYLTNRVKLTKVADPSTSSTASVNTSILDMAGYEGVVFFTSLGTANSGNLIKVQQDAANSTASMADLTGTSVSSGSSDEDVWVDVHRPEKRYVRAQVVRDGAASTLGDVWAIQYGPRTLPVDNTTSGTITGEQHLRPLEGTA